jgi:hypothetical protein
MVRRGGAAERPRSARSDRRTQRRWSVELTPYQLAVFPVTQAQYAEIAGQRPSTARGDRLPVEGVSWWDAVRYRNARSEHDGLTAAYQLHPDGEGIEWDERADGYDRSPYAHLGGPGVLDDVLPRKRHPWIRRHRRHAATGPPGGTARRRRRRHAGPPRLDCSVGAMWRVCGGRSSPWQASAARRRRDSRGATAS